MAEQGVKFVIPLYRHAKSTPSAIYTHIHSAGNDVLWTYWVPKSGTGSIYLISRWHKAPEAGLIYTSAFGDPMFP